MMFKNMSRNFNRLVELFQNKTNETNKQLQELQLKVHFQEQQMQHIEQQLHQIRNIRCLCRSLKTASCSPCDTPASMPLLSSPCSRPSSLVPCMDGRSSYSPQPMVIVQSELDLDYLMIQSNCY